jgi:hypothetical protein
MGFVPSFVYWGHIWPIIKLNAADSDVAYQYEVGAQDFISHDVVQWSGFIRAAYEYAPALPKPVSGRYKHSSMRQFL